ncbi:hypothetical protein PPO43_13080 [Saprospira sp. CCB-QB6]|uniref:hypothetical protein n=1 Tax=Saprospira sp. CCB-QB6 TaxID=3023936 RepID=UPI0023492B46|nr:hypothetical protein [Saprospira sp. CCB-QB6]WCL80902.1 hypothetical protein PPO43_13080 [Saprospira sp. CCB-QB6]
MHQVYTLCFLFMLFGFSLMGQPGPSPSKALLTLEFVHPETKARFPSLAFRLQRVGTKESWQFATDKEGKANCLLPINSRYELYVRESNLIANINIEAGEFQEHRIQIPFDGEGSPVIERNEELCHLKIQLINHQQRPYSARERVRIQDKKTGKDSLLWIEAGRLEIDLPKHSNYILSFAKAPNYAEIKLGGQDYWEEQVLFERKKGYEKFPSRSHGLVNFRYMDLEGQNVPNEPVEALDPASGERFTAFTNQGGLAQLLLPLGKTYLFSTAYNPHFEERKIVCAEGYELYELDLLYQAPSSRDWLKSFAQQAALNRLNDSLRADLLAQAEANMRAIQAEEERNKALDPMLTKLDLRGIKTFKIRKLIEQKSKILKDSLRLNPKVLENHYKKPILASLLRLQDVWEKRIIVTDVTASMSPYFEEILLWHSLNLMKATDNKYVFFNDGDNEMNSHKVLGRTGGLYYCQGKVINLEEIIGRLKEASGVRRAGGDAPENDIEALLAAQALRTDSLEEIILIADAFSPVRDMALLYQLNCPIRVILCGWEEGNEFYPKTPLPNPEYLTIAHRTGGSVHTLTQDLWDLSKKDDGDVIELSGLRFLLKNHQFIQKAKK